MNEIQGYNEKQVMQMTPNKNFTILWVSGIGSIVLGGIPYLLETLCGVTFPHTPGKPLYSYAMVSISLPLLWLFFLGFNLSFRQIKEGHTKQQQTKLLVLQAIAAAEVAIFFILPLLLRT